ncbi:MAG: ATP synthase F1 subunit delta [Polyangiaceae bacterium]
MSVSVVADRYAQALFELGIDEGQIDRLVEEFALIARAWAETAELRDALENPRVPHPAKKAVVAELAQSMGVSQVAKNTLELLVDRRRAKTIPFIARRLGELADAHKGVVRAEVTTAVTLDDSYYSRLQSQLERMTGKRVVVHRLTDPALIAGVVTRLGDRVFDGSLRTRLHSLRDAMMPGR